MSTVKLSPAAAAAAAAYSFSSASFRRQLLSNNSQFHRTSILTRNNFGHRHVARRSLTASMSSDPLPVCVKESVTAPNKLGDCPFCQRVLLTLEEKHLPYDMKLVDLSNKPEWFTKINPDGKVPVMKFDDNWVSDSDVIANSLEERYPSPSLATPPEKTSVGSKIFPAFVGFLKSKDPSDGKEQELLSELSSFNAYLKENGPYINGEKISAADLALGPKLYHMEIALGHYKIWSVPDSFPYVKSYMKDMFLRDSFAKTIASPDDVIAGWGKHLG